jgi:hypothetical protein
MRPRLSTTALGWLALVLALVGLVTSLHGDHGVSLALIAGSFVAWWIDQRRTRSVR